MMKLKLTTLPKIFNMILVVMILAFLHSCSNHDEPLPVIGTNLAERNTQFSFDIFKKVESSDKTGTFMISPLSLSMALGMAYNGAQGETQNAFSKTLHYGDFSVREINQFNKDLIDILSRNSLQLANSIWIRDDFTVKDEFINLNTKNYGASVSRLDFNNPQSVQTINNWVAEKTSNKIPKIIKKISSIEKMFLINAIYFNKKWLYKFDPNENTEIEFHTTPNDHILTEAMLTKADVLYTKNELFSSVILPYENNTYSMVLLLPNPGKSVKDMANGLTLESWKTYLSAYKRDSITITIPKFKIEYENKLNDELINLGLQLAFSNQANFSGISDTPLKISRVIQKTFVKVNEEGTEAAAVTLVGFVKFSALPSEKFFYVNRPFVFMIKENETGTICFMGKVTKPEYEE